MALFMKQDFTPPILSKKWLAMKFRPNMLLYSHDHIISILESGLLFREDSVDVEQEAPSADEVWAATGGGRGGWLSRGETVAAVAAVTVCLVAFPPTKLHRGALLNLGLYTSVPVGIRALHRSRCRGSLAILLARMRDYLTLVRRAAACLKEYAALHAHLDSLTSVIESTHTMLCRQQSELSILMSRASSALLGNAPWLRADVAWDAVTRSHRDENLMKIHHAFLVVQSTLLKHIAMAHYIPSVKAQRVYKNHNERIYWLHNVVIKHLSEEFKQNFESLERMYRFLKNSGNTEYNQNKKLGAAVNNSWLYSDVHSGVAKSCLELKLALNKSIGLDTFLDACALNNQQLDVALLNKDLDDLIDSVTSCLTTLQNSQIRLRKLKNRFGEKEEANVVEKNSDVEDSGLVQIEDAEVEAKDEVFYFVRTEDDSKDAQPSGDITTAPGKKEKETTKVVLSELKRKLGKREDIMRERERQALAKTMPEFKDKVPEFPRQIKFDEFVERKGFITKVRRKEGHKQKRRFRYYKISTNVSKNTKNKYKYKINRGKYEDESEIRGVVYEANAKLNVKSKLLTFDFTHNSNLITNWSKNVLNEKFSESSGLSDYLSDIEPTTSRNDIGNENKTQEIKFTKKDLELSPSSSENELDFYDRQHLLEDVRRYRAKKNNNTPHNVEADESMRPIKYNFGTGLAMASVLQVNNKARIANMAREEVFIGDGEVSEDSGNDEDA